MKGLLQRPLDEADYLDPFQSRFTLGHNTETTLATLLDNLWKAHSGDGATIMAFLDLSAAFDSIDHATFGWASVVGNGKFSVTVVLLFCIPTPQYCLLIL